MLSDQALLARCYLRASRVTHNQTWRDVALDTLAFVERDRCASPAGTPRPSTPTPAGGRFAHHLDARRGSRRSRRLSEETVDAALARWRIEPKGTFEGRSIPRLRRRRTHFSPRRILMGALRDVDSRRATPYESNPAETTRSSWSGTPCSRRRFSRGGANYESARASNSCVVARHSFAGDTWWRTEHHRAQATANDLAWLIDAPMDAYRAHRARRVAKRRAPRSRRIWSSISGTARYPSDIDSPRRRGFFTQSDLVGDLDHSPQGDLRWRHTLGTRDQPRAPWRAWRCVTLHVLLVIAQRLVEWPVR